MHADSTHASRPPCRWTVVETAEAWAQAECDADMVLRGLDTKAQGFPERCVD